MVVSIIFSQLFNRYLTQMLKNDVKIRLKVGALCVSVVLNRNSKFSRTVLCRILDSTAEGETLEKKLRKKICVTS